MKSVQEREIQENTRIVAQVMPVLENSVQLYIASSSNNFTQSNGIEPLRWVEKNERSPMSELCLLSYRASRELMTHLWNQGVRPNDVLDINSILGHKEKHISDLKEEIAFYRNLLLNETEQITKGEKQ